MAGPPHLANFRDLTAVQIPTKSESETRLNARYAMSPMRNLEIHSTERLLAAFKLRMIRLKHWP